ncbi:MAG TPA: hypothetical protein VFP50_02230 [Anaeromyxobacteraceae bacterium]|nr:hypothetical protein [Anaeromyxobacteraceae bacterium]
MVEATTSVGALSGDAVRELWCWLWAGIAEREHRIWREFSSSRDIRKEKLVLRGLLPRFDAAAGRDDAPARAPGLDLSKGAAFELLAWLGCILEALDAAAEQASGEPATSRLAEATAAIRMVLAQWVASLPPGREWSFHTTWDRLQHGVEAARVRPFAGWLGAEAESRAGDGDLRAELLGRAFERLAAAAGLTPGALRALAPPCPMPWTPPSPLLPAYLGGSSNPHGLFTVTLTQGDVGPERGAAPLHEFFAALTRR